jgi:glycyl-tRNA synthetase beta chain
MDGRPRPGWIDPVDALRRAETLMAFRTDARFEPLVVLFKRVANILRAATETLPGAVDRALLRDAEEQALATALDAAQSRTAPLWDRHDYRAIIPALLEMERTIHTFFDHVLVNAEDAKLRLNRLQLLSEVRALFLRGWDLSRVVVEGEKAAANDAVAHASR